MLAIHGLNLPSTWSRGPAPRCLPGGGQRCSSRGRYRFDRFLHHAPLPLILRRSKIGLLRLHQSALVFHPPAERSRDDAAVAHDMGPLS